MTGDVSFCFLSHAREVRREKQETKRKLSNVTRGKWRKCNIFLFLIRYFSSVLARQFCGVRIYSYTDLITFIYKFINIYKYSRCMATYG